MNNSTRTTRTTHEPFVMVPMSVLASGLSPRAIMVYIALASFRSSRDDVVWPSYKAIMQRSHIRGTATVHRAIDELEHAGLISRERRFGGSTRYTFQNTHYSISEIETPVFQNLKDSISEIERQSFKNENLTICTELDTQNKIQSTAVADAPATVDKPKRKKKDVNIPSGYGDLFVKIAAVCRIDPKIPKHAKQISSTAKYLAGRNVTPDMIDVFVTWWTKNDFRGQKGEYTSPSYIAQLWLQFEESRNTPAPIPRATQNRYAATQASKTGIVRRAQTFFTPEQRARAEADALRALAEDDF